MGTINLGPLLLVKIVIRLQSIMAVGIYRGWEQLAMPTFL